MARDENHPPLFFLLLRFWRDAFGDSATALRALSVVASVAAVALTVAAGTEAYGPTAGLWAGLLMAVASPQVREAQDARAYMPMTAVAMWALFTLVRINRRGPSRGRAAGLFVALLVLPLLHYMALATVGAVLIYAALGMSGPARRTVLAATAAALAAYAVLWGPHFLGQHQRMLDATQWMADPAAGHAWRTLGNLMAVPIRLMADPDGPIAPAVAVGGLIALAAPPLVLLARRRAARVAATPSCAPGLEFVSSSSEQPGRFSDPVQRPRCRVASATPPPGGPTPADRALLLLWVWFVLPVAVALVIDLTTGRQSLQMAKYTLLGAPALYLTLGAIAATGRRLAWVPAAVAVAAALICLPGVYDSREPDWRPLAQYVADSTGPADPVVLIGDNRPSDDEVSGMRVVGLLYYLSQSAHRDVYVLDGPPTGPVLTALRHARRACIVGSWLDPSVGRLLPGLAIGRGELFYGLAVAVPADRQPPQSASAGPLPPVQRSARPTARLAPTVPPNGFTLAAVIP